MKAYCLIDVEEFGISTVPGRIDIANRKLPIPTTKSIRWEALFADARDTVRVLIASKPDAPEWYFSAASQGTSFPFYRSNAHSYALRPSSTIYYIL